MSRMASGGLLLATPARMAHDNSLIIISSSPDFPSINDLLAKPAKKSTLRSGSNAVQLPSDAVRTFMTAASVWRSAQSEESDINNAVDGIRAHRTQSCDTPVLDPKACVKLPPKTAPTEEQTGAKKQRKPRNTTGTRRGKLATTALPESGTTESVNEPDVVGAPAPKLRKRSKPAKDPAGGQTTLPKGKVTKAAAKERAPKKKTEVVSRHFATPAPVPNPPADPIRDEPIVLEQAMRRRMDWTPPPENITNHAQSDSSAVKEVSSTALTDLGPAKLPQRELFENLLDNYGCQTDHGQGSPAVAAGADTNSDILGKRKLIELVATTMDKSKTPEVSPTKSKVPKKKPRTITELATAAYRMPEESDVPTSTEKLKQDFLLGYFGAEGEPAGNINNVPGGKTKGPKKAAKPRVFKKKADPRKQILLSPTSAMKQVSGQDFVFGTASQLATEEDPELLRALHEAMKASNQPDSDPFSIPVISDLASRRKVVNKLWAAGARDDDGELLDLELLDLTESPVPPPDLLPRIPVPSQKDPVCPSPVQKVQIEIQSSEYDLFDLTGSPALPTVPEPHFFLTQVQTKEKKKAIVAESPSLQKPDEPQQPSPVFDVDFEPPPSNQEHNQLIAQSQPQPSVSPTKAPIDIPPPPKFELWTDAKLAKEIASYGFKAVKKRETRIALLQECWENKQKTALGGNAEQAAMLTSSAKPAAVLSPGRARGRPKKTSAAAATTAAAPPVLIDPVPASPSRPRGRPRKDPAALSPPAADKPAGGRPRKNSRSASPAKTTKTKAKTRSPAPSKPAAASSVSAVSTPKRRKVAPAPPKAVVEIPDSDASDLDDEDPFASSPLTSPEKQDIFSSPPHQAKDISITEDTEDVSIMTTASPTSQQAELFRYISKAITTAPRTTDPAEPSWHEKMLMYDPIILEDLATWLNSGQLDRVGYDGEVAPHDVKLWCHNKSICCVWRVNLHGKARKRF
ncbi:structure-specific endonuclease subunit SLX4 [Apodospora peruviana]|uniref:Structure-specific endonuclease subunit SLX4 n=1 Tax=Apodospora peruviana TaxID=516989 RepID=A0AAE0MEF0_9PEZI|nr:structure-specific endonuclease subunit SLX4 [Apodospora peruviana]